VKLSFWFNVVTGILIFICLAACGGNSGETLVSYSDSSLTGNWIITEASRNFYMTAIEVTDRLPINEFVTEISRIDLIDYLGPTSVGNDGAFSWTLYNSLNGTSTSAVGRLLSPTSGTITIDQATAASTMNKVTDLSLCQGHYSGTLSNSETTSNISFDVDVSGVISNFVSNSLSIYSGKAYAVGNKAVMLLKGSPNYSVWGVLENGHFTGSYQTETYDGTISLVKS
jgi:hypothetical protein